MKIFDGVNVNTAALSPTWQGVAGVAMLLVNSLIEADKVRQEREAREQKQQATLGDVMEQAGLKIPGLHETLTHLMGGTEEARDAATMIVNTPDPGKLLRDFAQGFGPGVAANGPIVTPPPAAQPSPRLGPAPKLATFRPEFTREGLEAAAKATASKPRPKLASFRPEFTREGLEAAARAAGSGPVVAPAPTNPAAPPAAARPSTVTEVLEVELDGLERRMEAHDAELDSRLRCAEAELALLREELRELRATKDRPMLFVVPPTLEEASGAAGDEPAAVLHVQVAAEATGDIPTVGDTAEQAVREPPDEQTSERIGQGPRDPAAPTEATPTTRPASEVELPEVAATGPTLDAASTVTAATETPDHEPDKLPADPAKGRLAAAGATSEAELARAVALLGAFSTRVETRYAKQLEQVQSVECELSVLRALVAREREARSVASHG